MWITFHIPTYTFRHISLLPARICAFFHLIFFRIVKSKKILRNNYQNIVYKIGRFILLKAFYFTGRIFPWPNKRVLRTPRESLLRLHSFCSVREQAVLAVSCERKKLSALSAICIQSKEPVILHRSISIRNIFLPHTEFCIRSWRL